MKSAIISVVGDPDVALLTLASEEEAPDVEGPGLPLLKNNGILVVLVKDVVLHLAALLLQNVQRIRLTTSSAPTNSASVLL